MMNKFPSVAAFCLLPILFFARIVSAQESPPTLFQNVNVVDVAAGKIDPDRMVLVSGNRIVAIGASVPFPANAVVVDATGKFLIPGLWDMHSHALFAWEWSWRLNIANGVTGFRDPGSSKPIADIITLRDDVEAGRTMGPRFVASGKIIDGIASKKRAYVTVTTAAEMRQEVRQRKQDGLDFVKIYTHLSRDMFLAAVQESKQLDIPLDGHVPLAMTTAEASDAGMRSIEHSYRHRMACAIAEDEIRDLLLKQVAIKQSGYPKVFVANEDKDLMLGLETYSSEKCIALGRKFASNGTWFVPTLVEMRTRFRTDVYDDESLLKLFEDQRLRYMPAKTVGKWRDDMFGYQGFLYGKMMYGLKSSDVVEQEIAREFNNRLQMAADLHRGGARLLAGTDVDAIFQFLFYGSSLHDELGLLVQAGLSPLDALRTATLNPAIFLDRQDDLGTVEAGKLADLVLLDGNPIEDIGNTRKISAVVSNGNYFSRAELDGLLAEAEALVKE